jgi:hypothetical protein
MALRLKHSVIRLFHPGDILFQTMLTNSDGLLVSSILDPPAIVGKSRSHLTSLRIVRRVANK